MERGRGRGEEAAGQEERKGRSRGGARLIPCPRRWVTAGHDTGPAGGAGSLEGAPRDLRRPCAGRRRTRVTQQLVPAD